MPCFRPGVLRLLAAVSAAVASLGILSAQTSHSIHDVMTSLPNTPLLGQNVILDQGTPIVVGVIPGTASVSNGGFYLTLQTWDNDVSTSEGIFVAGSSLAGCQVSVGQVVKVTGIVKNTTAPNLTAANTPGTYIDPTACTTSGTAAMSQGISLSGSLSTFGDALKYTGMAVTNPSFYAIEPTTGTPANYTATVTSSGQFWATLNSNTSTNNHLFRSTGIAGDESKPSGAPSGVPTWSGNPQRVLIDTSSFGGTPVNITVGQTITCTNAGASVGSTKGIGVVDYSLGYARILIFKNVTCAVSGNIATSTSAAADSTHFKVGTLDLNSFYNVSGGAVTPTAAVFAGRLAKATLAVQNVFGTPDILAVQEVQDKATLQQIAAAVNTATGGATNYTAELVDAGAADTLNSGFLINAKGTSAGTIVDKGVTQVGSSATYATASGGTAKLWDHPPLVFAGEFIRVGKNYPVIVINVHFTPRDNIDDATLGPDIRARRAAQASAVSALVQQYQSTGANVIVAGNYNAYEYNDGYVDVVGVVTGAPAAATAVTLYQATSTTAPLTDFTTSVTANARYNILERGNAASLEHILASSTVTDSTTASASLASYINVVTQPHFSADYAAIDTNDSSTPAGLTPHDGFLVNFAIPPVPTTATLTPSTLSFGDVELGGNETLSLTFTNTSSFAPAQIDIGNIAINGTDAADFTQTSNCTAVTQNQTCSINVTFAPGALGTRTATLTVTSDSTSNPTLTASLTGNGIDTNATLSPAAATFPRTSVTDTSAAMAFTFTNTSKQVALTVATPTVTGDFAISANTCTASVAAGATCTIQVTFTPTVSGTRTGTLTVPNSSTGNAALTAALTGTGVDTTATLTTNPTRFADTDITGTSAAQTLTFANTSDIALRVKALAISGDFAITGGTCATNLSVPAAGTCTVTVAFSPTVAGARTGALTVTNTSSANGTLTAALNGTGLDTTATLTPASASFPDTYAGGGVSAAQTFTVTNTSQIAITIKAVTTTGDFTLMANNCAASLAAGATCTVQIAFAPTTSGALTGTLVVTNTTTANPTLTAALSGTGLPTTASLAPASINYGPVILTTTSSPVSFAWTNTSAIALKVTGASTTGDFTVANNGCGTVAAGASCTVQVVFTPSALGTRTGTLTLRSTASANPALTASLTGRGVADVEADVAGLDFGKIDVGSNATPQTVTITNYTAAAIAITGVTLSGDSSFTDNTTCGGTLGSKASCTVTVGFAPASTGGKSGTLTVTTNDTKVPVITVALAGTGVDFSVALTPASGDQIAGNGSMVPVLTVTPIAGYTGSISLSCMTTAAASTCTIPVTSTTLSGVLTQNVTITTTSRYTVVGYGWTARTRRAAVGAGCLGLCLGAMLAAARRRYRLPAHLLLAVVALVLAGGGLTGCGSKTPDQHGSYTAAGSYTYTVAVTDGTLTHSATYTLNVTER